MCKKCVCIIWNALYKQVFIGSLEIIHSYKFDFRTVFFVWKRCKIFFVCPLFKHFSQRFFLKKLIVRNFSSKCHTHNMWLQVFLNSSWSLPAMRSILLLVIRAWFAFPGSIKGQRTVALCWALLAVRLVWSESPWHAKLSIAWIYVLSINFSAFKLDDWSFLVWLPPSCPTDSLFLCVLCLQCILGSVLRCPGPEGDMWTFQWGQGFPWLCE